ncbi:MAG: alpha/beta fold hydrolase [Cytophagales bacterium]|nr:alpha/beta fold hydrolase [Cytophagales bacterium]
MSLIKKICSILFVAYDICGCCDCNCLLYQAYKSDHWRRRGHPFYVSKELMPISDKDEFIKLHIENAKNFKEYVYSVVQQNTTKDMNDNPTGFWVSRHRKTQDDTEYVLEQDDNDEVTSLTKYQKKRYLLSISNIPCVFIKAHTLGAKNHNAKRPLLVFYHGNGDTIFGHLDDSIYDKLFLLNVLSYYYDILIPELPGYNINQRGDFSETTRNKQINAIYQWCQEYYADKLVVMGHSLGCHFAILLAAQAQNNCKHLVLCNPFMTDKTAARHIVGCCGKCHILGGVITKPFYREKLNNGQKIKDVKCGIDFYYSLKDTVVDPQDAESLYEISKQQNNSSTRELCLLPVYSVKNVWSDTCDETIANVKYLPMKDLQKYENKVYDFNTGHGNIYCKQDIVVIRLFKKILPAITENKTSFHDNQVPYQYDDSGELKIISLKNLDIQSVCRKSGLRRLGISQYFR